MLLDSEALTMVHTCKNVAPSLNVGAIVNASLCVSIYLFLFYLCHPYILIISVEYFYYFKLIKNGRICMPTDVLEMFSQS